MDVGLYCNKVMLFGVNNVRDTYQLPMNSISKDEIGRMIEVYMNDMPMKPRRSAGHLKDSASMFGIFRRYGMKLNPLKCSFGVALGKFLSLLQVLGRLI